MANEALRLYAGRKTGRGQPLSWRLRNLLSTFLVLAVSLALSFALVFISSMGSGVDEVLQLLGSGTLYSTAEIPAQLLPDDARTDVVQSTSAVLYSGSATALATVKGVDDDYFFPRRAEALDLVTVENSTSLQPVVLSETMAHELGVSCGDRIAMMISDSALARVRPVFLFVQGTYNTGYGEFDSALVFTSRQVTGSRDGWEILISGDSQGLVSCLTAAGYQVTDYRQMYSQIYQNLVLSVSLLQVIVVLIAFLAGFFSLSVAAEYIERDRRDIAMLLIIGVQRRAMASVYVRITMKRVAIACLAGMALGLVASYLFIPLLSSLDAWEHPALQSYVTNFSVRIPYASLAFSFAALLASSYVSLLVSMKRSLSSFRLALFS